MLQSLISKGLNRRPKAASKTKTSNGSATKTGGSQSLQGNTPSHGELRPGDFFSPPHPAIHPPAPYPPSSAPTRPTAGPPSTANLSPESHPDLVTTAAPASTSTTARASTLPAVPAGNVPVAPTSSATTASYVSAAQVSNASTSQPRQDATGRVPESSLSKGSGWSYSADTTLDSRTAPAVVHETIIPHRHEIVQKHVTKEIHEHHVLVKRQPIFDTKILPPKHFTYNESGELIELKGLEMGEEWEAAWRRSIAEAALNR